jgi:hypothetical protein
MSLLTKVATRITNLRDTIRQLKSLPRRMEAVQTSIGRIEAYLRLNDTTAELSRHEFKVYSQNGDDGIIQFLLNRVPIEQKIFVEFGVEDYTEANTRFLLQNNYWSGLVIDGSPDNIARIVRERIYWQYNLKAICAFINCENIDDILMSNGLSGDIGLLSIDIDGNDYWVWQAIKAVSPRIVICEYNSSFGPTHKVTTPYDPTFVRSQAHFSYLYYGTSIAALDYLAKELGYSLVGSNRAGNNLFFVRNDVRGTLPVLTPEQAYVKAQFREARNAQGQQIPLDFAQRVAQIADLPLYDLETNKLVTLRSLHAS